MRGQRGRRIAALLVVGMLAAACGSSPTPSPTPLPLTAEPTETPTAAPEPTPTPFGSAQPRLASSANGEQLVDPELGWVGSPDTFFGTADGGATWHELFWGDLVVPWFVNSQHGWAIGRPDLLRTEDGGSTWQVMPLPLGYHADDLLFMTAARGYVLAHTAARRLDLLWTDDAGAHWAVQQAEWPTLTRTYDAFEPIFFDRQRGFLELVGPADFDSADQAPTLYRTADGGRSWQSVDLPRPASAGTDSLPAAVAFATRPAIFDASTAIVERAWVTRDGADEVTAFYLTTDAGQHWTLANATAGTGPVQALSPVRWILGTATGLHETSDGGQTWHELGASGLPQPWRWFDFVDDLHGWASTGVADCPNQDGPCRWTAMYGTSDGGRSWTQLHP